MNDLQDFLVLEVIEALMDHQDLQGLTDDLENQDLKDYLESKVHSHATKEVEGFFIMKKYYLHRTVKSNVLFLMIRHCRRGQMLPHFNFCSLSL